jgi:hypothetical protein
MKLKIAAKKVSEMSISGRTNGIISEASSRLQIVHAVQHSLGVFAFERHDST